MYIIYAENSILVHLKNHLSRPKKSIKNGYTSFLVNYVKPLPFG